MKRERIRGLKVPEKICLALVSLLSDTENQKECKELELLLALTRQEGSTFWGVVCPVCNNPVIVIVRYLVLSTPPSCRNTWSG